MSFFFVCHLYFSYKCIRCVTYYQLKLNTSYVHYVYKAYEVVLWVEVQVLGREDALARLITSALNF